MVCLYGGVSRGQQAGELSRSLPHVVIATPGRLLDLASGHSPACPLGWVSYLVFDEADRMLDMGFKADMDAIVRLIGPPAPNPLAQPPSGSTDTHSLAAPPQLHAYPACG